MRLSSHSKYHQTWTQVVSDRASVKGDKFILFKKKTNRMMVEDDDDNDKVIPLLPDSSRSKQNHLYV